MTEIKEAIFDEMTDKSQWGAGPWQDEPDRVEFEHLGFPCLINRNMRHGNLCGYVAVPPGHPWHGKDRNELDVEAHGGLTYSAACHDDICHVPKAGEPDDVWWLGFDCAHFLDVSPGLDAFMEKTLPDHLKPRRHLPETLGALDESWTPRYRTVAYVRAQCEALAEQAKAAAG